MAVCRLPPSWLKASTLIYLWVRWHAFEAFSSLIKVHWTTILIQVLTVIDDATVYASHCLVIFSALWRHRIRIAPTIEIITIHRLRSLFTPTHELRSLELRHFSFRGESMLHRRRVVVPHSVRLHLAHHLFVFDSLWAHHLFLAQWRNEWWALSWMLFLSLWRFHELLKALSLWKFWVKDTILLDSHRMRGLHASCLG